jgi:Domain of unknown function (DUF4129)
MQPVPGGSGRSARLALIAVGLLALLGVVAFASRSGFGHKARATPTPQYVSYAFTAFLIVFVVAIPVAMYAFVLQAREGDAPRKSFQARVIQNLATMAFFGVLAFIFIYLKRHHHHFLGINFHALTHPQAAKHGHRGGAPATPYEPRFEWAVFWIALAVILAGGGYATYRWRTRKRRKAIPLDRAATVADELAATIGDALDDLEAEPDPRRAVIAAYARMEGVLARNGLRRRPSETPLEYLRRVLLGLTSRGEAVQVLTGLFEQAKFSRHEIDAAMKVDAISALREIRDDLQGAPA